MCNWVMTSWDKQALSYSYSNEKETLFSWTYEDDRRVLLSRWRCPSKITKTMLSSFSLFDTPRLASLSMHNPPNSRDRKKNHLDVFPILPFWFDRPGRHCSRCSWSRSVCASFITFQTSCCCSRGSGQLTQADDKQLSTVSVYVSVTVSVSR